MDSKISKISIDWAHGAAANNGKIEVSVCANNKVDSFFALARATSGILRHGAKADAFDALLLEYIGLLIYVAHHDGEKAVGPDFGAMMGADSHG